MNSATLARNLTITCLMLSMLAGTATAATQGTITKVDTSTQKITIKHGEIKNLDMPAMTMAFRASPNLLSTATVGATVEFEAEKVNGQYTLQALKVLSTAP